MKKTLFRLIGCTLAAHLFALSTTQTNAQAISTENNYNQGIVFLNEGWYGHGNGTANFLDADKKWHYNVYQTENPGKELGASTQYGTFYADKLFIISKQPKDPGATIGGSRLAVCNAQTLESIAEFTTIGNSDGRSFVGVNEEKAYIGTSNGIYLFDLQNLSLGKKLQGTENSTNSLYNGQIGTMIQSKGSVFAVNQQKGILIINAQSDTIIKTIAAPIDGTKQRGIGSIVQSKDGNIWISIATNISGSGGGEDYMLRLDPETLDTTRIALPKGTSIPNSWYAWTADGFCASTQQNKIYWKNNGGWSNSTRIYEYDIDQNSLRTVIDLTKFQPAEQWGIYGAGFRLDPITDQIYISLFKSFGETDYTVIQVDTPSGQIVGNYPLDPFYWFPAMPVFPDKHAPILAPQWTASNELNIQQNEAIFLGDKVSDQDNISASIIKKITDNSHPNRIEAEIRKDSLFLNVVPDATGSSFITIQFNSNGKLVSHTLQATIATPVNNPNKIHQTTQVYPTVTSSKVHIAQSSIIEPIQLYNTTGALLYSVDAPSKQHTIGLTQYPAGIYIIKVGNSTHKVIKK